MDAVTREFEGYLAATRASCAGRPRRELLKLLLLALEREQMVTISYRERLITDRLRRTALSHYAQDLIRHALIWVWKDEEMHAVYLRGLLLKMGSIPLKISSILQQANGTIGGWASSVRMHVPWSRAPGLRALATLLQWAGIITGKVPREVQKELDYHPFRHFCEFNVDAERTASLCWQRLAEVAASLPELPSNLVDEFRRMKADEDNHCRVFEAIALALGPDDRLAPSVTETDLAGRLRAFGDEFLPRALRGIPPEQNPLGTGGRIAIRSGDDPTDTLRRALDDGGLPAVLARHPRGFRAAIKATFMMGYDRRDPSPHVDPRLAEFLARYLRAHGAGDVALVEGPNIYDHFFRNRSVGQVARVLGFTSDAYRVVDLALEQVPHRYGRGMAQYTVGRTWKEADVRLVFGKMKSHPVDVFTLALSAVEGIGPRNEEFLFAERQAHRSTAIMTLLSDFPPHFAVVDAFDHVPDGILGMMGSVHTKRPRRIYAGEDAVALDLVAARHLGLPDPRVSSTLRDACHWFGDPEGKTVVDGDDERIRGWRGPYDNEISALLSSFSHPFYTFFTGRGALFVPEMDPREFPPVEGEGVALRIARRSIQTLLILRHMK
jgi:uncharacterized protein (DUF362 family)